MPLHRVCNTDDLKALDGNALRHNLNRTLTPEFMEALDPGGNHLLAMLLFDHHKYGGRAPMHHRVLVLAKMADSTDPTTVYLDVLDTDWNRLLTPEQAKALLGIDAE